jgi:hypothetical protein
MHKGIVHPFLLPLGKGGGSPRRVVPTWVNMRCNLDDGHGALARGRGGKAGNISKSFLDSEYFTN